MDPELTAHAEALARPWLTSGRPFSPVIGLLHEGQTHVVGRGRAAGERVYEIGSVTKLFTAALLADLVLQGKARLEEPVPALCAASPEPPITLLHLATHTSGLPRLPPNLRLTRESYANPYAHYLPADLEQLLAAPLGARGHVGRYAYSNLGMGLLGHLLAARWGRDYEEAVVTRLCLPLGMEDTRMALTPEQERRRVRGYSARGRRVPDWDFPALPGAGALRSTASDMLKFLAAHLTPTSGPLTDALRLCLQPRHWLARHQAVGLGWNITERKGRQLLWHNGATGGFNSFVGLLPEQRFGVVVLVNRSLTWAADRGLTRDLATSMGVRLLRPLFRHR